MSDTTSYATGIIKRDVISARLAELGRCLELVAVDPHFKQVTVGLYLKGKTLTIATFSTVDGADERIETIRNRLCQLADVEPVAGSGHQATVVSNELYDRALRFAFTEAVEKNNPIPTGAISLKDTKSVLVFTVEPQETDDGWIYVVTATGDYARPEMRIRAVVGGYMRYGECERVDWDRFRFRNGERLDRFARLLLPYARNVSAVEDLLTASDMAGQMTTQTLGFSQN